MCAVSRKQSQKKWQKKRYVGVVGGEITHHHAVGRDHSRWMPDEVGPLGIEALRALKARLDPTGVMNPGKLLPAG